MSLGRGRTARDVPPPLELECLRALWALGEGNVQTVKDHLAPRRVLAYTTVMTMLDRLRRKQMLERRKVGRAFVYVPAVSRDEIRRRAIHELEEGLFDGSREAMLAYLLGRPARGGDEAEGGRLDAVLL